MKTGAFRNCQKPLDRQSIEKHLNVALEKAKFYCEYWPRPFQKRQSQKIKIRKCRQVQWGPSKGRYHGIAYMNNQHIKFVFLPLPPGEEPYLRVAHRNKQDQLCRATCQ